MTAPAAPRLRGRSANGTVMRLRWQPVDGATDYKLYVKGGGYAPLVKSMNPVAYWRLGEASGTVAYDEMGAHDGTYLNSPTMGAAGLLTGDADTAVTFNGSSQRVGVVPTTFPYGAAPRTIVAFVNASALGSNRAWFTYGSSTPGGAWFYCYVTSAGQLRVYDGTAERELSVAGAVTVGSVHHLAVAYDGANLTGYVNGVVGLTVPVALDTTYNVNAYIASEGGSSWWSGTIDEPAIWDRALSAVEVASLYTAGTTHPGDADHYGLEDDIPDDDIGSDGWFQYTFIPDDVNAHVAITALNLAGEESALSNALHFRLTGPG